MGFGAGNGMHLKSPGIQSAGDAAYVASLASGIPAFISQYDGDFFAVKLVMQLP